jgi:hypothetical protein
MKAEFAGPSRTELFSPLSVVRLPGRFATPVMRLVLPGNEIANFPKNEHWRRRIVEDSILCETNLPVFEHAR